MNHDGEQDSDPPPFAELENETWFVEGNKQKRNRDRGKSGESPVNSEWANARTLYFDSDIIIYIILHLYLYIYIL